MIECICTQRKPLPLDILFKAMEITEFEGRTRLGYVASFFPIKREKSKNSIIQEKFDETVNETVKPFHRSIIDWLTGKNQNTGLFKAGVYAIDLKDGNNKLANGCWYEYKNWNNNPSSQLISDYTLHYLIQHLMEIDQPSAKEKLEEIINDADFNKLRLSRGLHRIYISYAPKEISFTKRLKKDLSNVGHYITNEIDESDVFMLLMTPQSVNRPDGDCLNEIAYALQKNLVPIPIMISWCDPPLSISRIQWLDMQNCIPFEENDEVYNQVFQVLLERLKTPEIIIDKYKSLFRIS